MHTSTLLRVAASLAVIMLLVGAGFAHAGTPKPATAANPSDTLAASRDTAAAPAHKVIAYYFHGDKRCPTCIKLETYTSEAIDSAFADQLKSSALEWRVVNTDSAQNKHFTEDYKLYTKSVILSDVHNGTQTRWKNLDQIWELVGDRDKFCAYIQDEVRLFLDPTK